MPLYNGVSKKVIQKNIVELINTKPSKTRAKAVKTLAKKQGISPRQAKIKQAIAIAYSKARRGKK